MKGKLLLPLSALLLVLAGLLNHVVTVSKEDQWGQKIDFDLEVDGKQLAEETKFIP